MHRGYHVYITGITSYRLEQPIFCRMRDWRSSAGSQVTVAPTGVRIGDNNVFREHVTVHRSTKTEEDTVIGSHNFLMQHSHVGHNCVVNDNVILASGALLGGHATVHDRAFVSGNCLVHQFVRVGTLSMMQGGSGISKDLPPFTMARRITKCAGLTQSACAGQGSHPKRGLELKRLYKALFRQPQTLRAALAAAQQKFSSRPAKIMMDFIAGSKRGVCADASVATASESEEESVGT